MPRDSSEWVLQKSVDFQFWGQKCIQSQNDKTKNDAMVNIYPLECSKLIIWLNKIENSGKSIETDDGPGGH